MPFELGRKKTGGIKKGTKKGRSKAINLVDIICGQAKNLATLKNALQEKFDEKPLWFFMHIVMPLAPKQLDITGLKDSGYATMTPAEAAAEMLDATIGTRPASIGDRPASGQPGPLNDKPEESQVSA